MREKNSLRFDGGPEAVDIEVDTSSGNVKLLAN
jgi:hypothetical protein